MRYFRAYLFPFDRSTGIVNVLLGGLCQVVPFVGPVAFLGYAYEVVEGLHCQGGRAYPNFDVSQVLKYLVRGIWPFLIQLMVVLPAVLLAYLYAAVIVGVFAAAGGEPEPVALLILFATGFLFMIVVFSLVSFVAVPMSLHAGLSQELALTSALRFLFDFWRRVWIELAVAQLFMLVSGWVVTIVGLALCCVGAYPAMALILLAQHYFQYQLYELYLERGGREIPIKIELAPRDDGRRRRDW